MVQVLYTDEYYCCFDPQTQPNKLNTKLALGVSMGQVGNVALSDKTGFHQGWNEDFGDANVDFLLTL